MPIKFGMVSLGCSKNLVDSERMLYKFRKRGYDLVTEPGLSDIAVVNTCGFIQSAKEEAIETILELVKLKEEGTIKKIVVTGCLSERYQQEMADEFPEIDAVVGIGIVPQHNGNVYLLAGFQDLFCFQSCGNILVIVILDIDSGTGSGCIFFIAQYKVLGGISKGNGCQADSHHCRQSGCDHLLHNQCSSLGYGISFQHIGFWPMSAL